MTNLAATSEPSPLELGILDAMDALNECPGCELGTFPLSFYRENGRVKVECGICGGNRNFTDALKPTQ